MRTILISLLLAAALTAQERVLLRIGANGQQEAIPLKKGEHAKDVIERLEAKRASQLSPAIAAGLIDTIRYFSSPSELTTNFGFTHQDVGLQWYDPQEYGVVKEFWWHNYLQQGVIKKATIRAWHIDPRVKNLPVMPNANYFGTYKDVLDGDGGVQPFKPAAGDQWFYSNGAADSVTYSFDPMKEETAWLKGGMQVTLDSNVWQGIKLDDFGDSLVVRRGEPFGFTISNDTKKSDIGVGNDTRMEILSIANNAGAPFHSFKFYETGRTAPSNAGWHMRGDYDWGMYVVIEYSSGPRNSIFVGNYGTTLQAGQRLITATVRDDNPSGDSTGYPVLYLKSKTGRLASYDSVVMIRNGTTYSGYTVPAAIGDTVYWYIVGTFRYGDRTVTPARSYMVFKKRNDKLFIYNNGAYSLSIANVIYTRGSTDFDRWSAPNDGTSELATLMELYNYILVADGSFPSRNVFTALKGRLANATAFAPVAMFYTSQDYGCYIESNCADTTFVTGSLEYDYFGISKLGPQDLPPTNRPFRIIPQADTVTNYLIRFGADSGSTLWHDPTYELGYSGYPDAMTPRPEAKALFKDGGSNVIGVKYITPATRVMYLGFDAGALQFRSDTSIAAPNDPKYKWVPTDVGALSRNFFYSSAIYCDPNPVGVQGDGITAAFTYSLEQNYPNPFNPVTTISYSLAAAGPVTITVYNALGQRVAVVVNGPHEAGEYQAEWNAANIPSGLYFCEMRTGLFVRVKKMMVLK